MHACALRILPPRHTAVADRIGLTIIDVIVMVGSACVNIGFIEGILALGLVQECLIMLDCAWLEEFRLRIPMCILTKNTTAEQTPAHDAYLDIDLYHVRRHLFSVFPLV